MKIWPIKILSVCIFALLALAFIAGCGGDEQQAQAPDCDPNAATIIPAPQGKAQLVEFYRDT